MAVLTDQLSETEEITDRKEMLEFPDLTLELFVGLKQLRVSLFLRFHFFLHTLQLSVHLSNLNKQLNMKIVDFTDNSETATMK